MGTFYPLKNLNGEKFHSALVGSCSEISIWAHTRGAVTMTHFSCCVSTPSFWGSKDSLGVKFPGPFLAGNCAEIPQFEGGAVRISTENGGKFAENRTLTDVNRRYFGVDGRFSAVNRR